jgi:hypothetical protein
MLTLTYEGAQVYKSRKLGFGVVIYLGNGCAAYQCTIPVVEPRISLGRS